MSGDGVIGTLTYVPDSSNTEPTHLFLSAYPSKGEVRACRQTQPEHTYSSAKVEVTSGFADITGSADATFTGNSSGRISGTARATAKDNAVICASGAAEVAIQGNATAYLRDNAYGGVAMDHATFFARGHGEVHVHDSGVAHATDDRTVLLNDNGIAYGSMYSATWVREPAPGYQDKVYARDHSLVVTYADTVRGGPRPAVFLSGKALSIDYSNANHTLTVTDAKGHKRAIAAPDGSTIWLRDSYAKKNDHQVAGGDDIVFTLRKPGDNTMCSVPPFKLRDHATWVDFWTDPGLRRLDVRKTFDYQCSDTNK
jgi:hypothetical protein